MNRPSDETGRFTGSGHLVTAVAYQPALAVGGGSQKSPAPAQKPSIDDVGPLVEFRARQAGPPPCLSAGASGRCRLAGGDQENTPDPAGVDRSSLLALRGKQLGCARHAAATFSTPIKLMTKRPGQVLPRATAKERGLPYLDVAFVESSLCCSPTATIPAKPRSLCWRP